MIRAGWKKMADKTTGGLPASIEATIGSLPDISDLYDDTLIPVEQQGEARHMTGAQWKKYAQAGVQDYVERAHSAADRAADSAAEALKSEEKAALSAADAAGSAQSAREYSGNPPVIQDGRWWTWNSITKEYEDTGEAARGSLMYATFYVDAASGELWMVTDREYTGPGFRLINGDLEVVLNYG